MAARVTVTVGLPMRRVLSRVNATLAQRGHAVDRGATAIRYDPAGSSGYVRPERACEIRISASGTIGSDCGSPAYRPSWSCVDILGVAPDCNRADAAVKSRPPFEVAFCDRLGPSFDFGWVAAGEASECAESKSAGN